MNNIHPAIQSIFDGYAREVSENAKTLTRLKPTPTDDYFLIQEHKAVLVKHLNAALAEIGLTAVDFVSVDADQYMVDVRGAFCPNDGNASVQDAFVSAFYAAQAALPQPLTSVKRLPSGCAVPKD